MRRAARACTPRPDLAARVTTATAAVHRLDTGASLNWSRNPRCLVFQTIPRALTLPSCVSAPSLFALRSYMPHFMDGDVFSGGNAFMQTFGQPVPLVEAYAMADEAVEPCNAPALNPAGHCH